MLRAMPGIEKGGPPGAFPLPQCLLRPSAGGRSAWGAAGRETDARAMPALVIAAVLASLSVTACAHRTPGASTAPGVRWEVAASRVPAVTFEDEFVEARLVFQALPGSAAERVPLRANLLRYLLDPLAPLNAERLRREAAEVNSTDVFDRVFESLRDALSLFEPEELAATLPSPAPAPAVASSTRPVSPAG